MQDINARDKRPLEVSSEHDLVASPSPVAGDNVPESEAESFSTPQIPPRASKNHPPLKILIPTCVAAVLLSVAVAVLLHRRRQAHQMRSGSAITANTTTAANALDTRAPSGNNVTPSNVPTAATKASSNALYDFEDLVGPSTVPTSQEPSGAEASNVPEASHDDSAPIGSSSCMFWHARLEPAEEASGREAAEEGAEVSVSWPPRPLTVAVRRRTWGPHTLLSDDSHILESSGAGTTVRACSPRRTPPTLVPVEAATVATRMKFVHEQLDCYGASDLLNGYYRLLGCNERRCGGVLLSHCSVLCSRAYYVASLCILFV